MTKDERNADIGLFTNPSSLARYPFTGHSALMGGIERSWQDTEYVLALFGKTVSKARKALNDHLIKWSAKGRCTELTGGGLIRSAGGWRAVKDAYRDGIKIASDERILGSSDFVDSTLNQCKEKYDRRTMLRAAGVELGPRKEIIPHLACLLARHRRYIRRHIS